MELFIDFGLLIEKISSSALTSFPFLVTIYLFLQIFSVVFSLLLVTGIIYCLVKINKVEKSIDGKIVAKRVDIFAVSKFTNNRWIKVKEMAQTNNPNDWRHAILEADIILGEMLDSMGYRGDSIGEQLKLIEVSDFNTLNDAWEAHKVRNKVAHEGSAFLLNRREVDRTISLYENVFEEFHYI